MLPNKWRLVARNNTGDAVTINAIKVTPWSFATDGSVQYGSEDDLTIADPGNGNSAATAERNNATLKYFGIKGIVEATGTGPSGALEIYIEWPSDDGNYPSDRGGANVPQDCIQLAALTPAGTGRATNFSYE